jgi:hypothetical protein
MDPAPGNDVGAGCALLSVYILELDWIASAAVLTEH